MPILKMQTFPAVAGLNKQISARQTQHKNLI